MGMTIAEKILASKSGATGLKPGDIVDAYPDLVMSHTATWRSVSVMRKIGATKLYDPKRLAIVLDHVSPAKTEKYAADQQTSRSFAREYGIEKFYDVDAGIAHLVLMEHGHVRPGDLIVGTDSHCTIYGALGAFGTGIGYTEVTSVWLTGKLWLKVPATVRFTLDGAFPAAVSAKDLMLRLIGTLGAEGCGYRSAEFYGDALPHMSVSERMTVANLAMEMGAKCVFVPPDARTPRCRPNRRRTRLHRLDQRSQVRLPLQLLQ
jgi:3-isopropylmalate/(R)-2-methylmalate dehydratase large subunit